MFSIKILIIFALIPLLASALPFANAEGITCPAGEVEVVRVTNPNPICIDQNTAQRWVQLGIAEIVVQTSSEIENQFEKTKLRLNDITTSSFNGGSTIGLSGNLQTKSGEFIPNAEILIVGDGPCPSDGIIAKGLTDKHGRYRIYLEMMIWDPSDNLIKIHAEYLGDEIYSPSSSQDEVIIVYPTTYTKSCQSTGTG